MSELLQISAFGLLAGLLTTVGGLGGGTLLVAALTATTDAHTALAVSAPALLVGNLHRLYITREALPGASLRPLLLGGLLGAVAGGSLTRLLPDGVLQLCIVGSTLLALVGAFVRLPSPPNASGLPWGAVVGALSSAGGGAALLMNPWLRARGLQGAAYVASASSMAVTLHLGRIAAFGVGGLIGAGTLGQSALLAVMLPLGNLLGMAVVPSLSAVVANRLQIGLLVLTALFTLLE
jgi:uncharacterized membrane protein YfcA